MKKSDIKLIVILGPTASGKSDIAIRLAQKFHGEIISADSRQVYRGLDIGTGKVTKAEQRMVRHHLLDIVPPGKRYSVAQFKRQADAAIRDIVARRKIPFLVGGSALYIKAVVENYSIPQIKEDTALRKKLEAKTLPQLLAQLKRRDPKTFASIDRKNQRRVVRALEVSLVSGDSFVEQRKMESDRYNALLLGITFPREKLYTKIDARVDVRIRRGMFGEVRKLLNGGVSKKWLSGLGLEYRFLTEYGGRPQTPECKQETIQRLKYAIHDFARRQLVWWRKDPAIHWVSTFRMAVHDISQHIKN